MSASVGFYFFFVYQQQLPFFPTPFKPILENAKMVFSTNLKACLNQMKSTADSYFTKEGRKSHRASKLGV